jgi:hypothetical protein
VGRIKAEPAIQDFSSLPELLDEKLVSAVFGVSLSFLRKGRAMGTVGGRTPGPRFTKIGRRVLYKKNDLLAWLESLPTRA